MKASVIVQARFNSRRLPGKVLLKILGRTVLEYVLERAGKAETVKRTVVAASSNRLDLPIEELSRKSGVSIYRGSEDDVLDRFYRAASLFGMKHIVRVTADCPLIDPAVIDRVARRYFSSGADYCSNTLDVTFPDGEDVEVFSFKALEDAWRNARLASEREHVTPYIVKNKKRFKLVNVRNRTDLSDKRWTLDEKADFGFIKKVLENLYPSNPAFGMADILRFLDSDRAVEAMNRHIWRNEGYRESLKKDALFRRMSGGKE